MKRIVVVAATVFLSIITILALFTDIAPIQKMSESKDNFMSVRILNVPLIYQHKDTNMICVRCGASNSAPHAWNDSSGLDGIYGTLDDCPHCSSYCAPASIAMIAKYHNFSGNRIQQDDIYDNGKQSDGETKGDGILQTHGVGMYDGTGNRPTEVQTSFQWAIGNFFQYGSGTTPLTGDVVISSINNGHPILWLDHNGWPANISTSLPGWDNMSYDQGHAKVIIGYDENNTPDNYSDDRYLINDPWPEYNDKSILPFNASLGPGGSYDPYWIPASMVLNDQNNDVELIDNIVIPEFSNVILTLASITGIFMLAIFTRKYRGSKIERET